MRRGHRVTVLILTVTLLAGCGGGSSSPASGSRLTIVVAENFWGSIVAQLAGDRAAVSSIIVNPAIFSPLAAALHLRVVTPASFVGATAEGNEPTAKDKTIVDRQIKNHEIKVLVFNTQNATPDVQRLVDQARRERIAIATVTETLSPANVTFQAWQIRQLRALQRALAVGTGR